MSLGELINPSVAVFNSVQQFSHWLFSIRQFLPPQTRTTTKTRIKQTWTTAAMSAHPPWPGETYN